MKTATQILVKAKLLFRTKDWIQYTLAVNNEKCAVEYIDPSACGFCMLGAFFHSKNELPINLKSSEGMEAMIANSHALRALETAVSDLSEGRYADIPEFNDADKRTRKEVLAAFDRAIKIVGEE